MSPLPIGLSCLGTLALEALVADPLHSQILDVFTFMPQPKTPSSEVSSAGQSSEHLHLVARDPLNINAKVNRDVDGKDSEEDEQEDEQDQDEVAEPASSSEMAIEEPNSTHALTKVSFGRVNKLQGGEVSQYLNKEERETARWAMG